MSDALPRLAVLCAKLNVGFGILAKHALSAELAADATALAAAHQGLAERLVDLALSFGMETPRIKTTCGERLRWEWLASAARLTDGSSESQLLVECTRLQREAAAVDVDAAALESTEVRQIRAELERAGVLAARLEVRGETPRDENAFPVFASPGA